MKLKKASERNFQKILSSSKPVIVDFSAPWCTACVGADKILSEFAEENPSFDVYKLDVDENMDVTNLYGVMNVPTVMVFENKKVKSKITGSFTKSDIENLIEQ